jgi:hypothetical protein
LVIAPGDAADHDHNILAGGHLGRWRQDDLPGLELTVMPVMLPRPVIVAATASSERRTTAFDTPKFNTRLETPPEGSNE